MGKAALILMQSLFALVVVGSTWVVGSTAYFPLTKVDFDEGRVLFEQRCSSCHSVDASGNGSYGPNLVRIGAVAGQRVEGRSAEEYLLESIVDPDASRAPGESGVMPANISIGLDREEILSIVGYLMTFGGSPSHERLLGLTVALRHEEADVVNDLDIDRVETGRRLYIDKGKCIKCHPLQYQPGFDFRGPSLIAAGRHDQEYLLESIRDPSRKMTPGYETWKVLLTDGKSYSGRIIRRNDDSITLLIDTEDGLKEKTILHQEIETDGDGQFVLLASPQSTMPNGFQEMLSDVEMECVVEFLKTLH